MYYCINCGAQVEELYKRYCPSVLKLLECSQCGQIADKYIEYDPVIILVDLILVEKQAYRHFLYNSDLKSYWKFLVVLWLAESFRIQSFCDNEQESFWDSANIVEQSRSITNANFYWILLRTASSIAAFLASIVIITEFRWKLGGQKPSGYSAINLIKAIILGSVGKLVDFLGLIWKTISTGPHHVLIQGYTVFCLITAYSVVCNSGKLSSSIVLAIALLVHALLLPSTCDNFDA